MPMSNPKRRGDTYLEAIITHLYWADELVIVDGAHDDGYLDEIAKLNDSRIRIVSRPWPQVGWSWAEFAKAWNCGLDACTGDWVAAGETDHIFHENEAPRVREEIERETKKNRAVVKVQKLQSGFFDHWHSKSQMYYFINKKTFPLVRYGFSVTADTDLAHPIWWTGEMYEDIPQGEAIVEKSRFEPLIGGTGAVLYNYLWTFKTIDMVIAERSKASAAWNAFSGFREIYKKGLPGEADVEGHVRAQIRSVREKSNRIIPLEMHPKVMQERIAKDLRPGMIGHEGTSI